MKIRSDFVTNSSSSSYICCFARVADKEKAAKIIEENSRFICRYTADEVLKEIRKPYFWLEWLECDWARVNCTPKEKYILAHMDDDFIVIEECQDLEPDEDGEVDYYSTDPTDFAAYSAIDEVTAENGFADIDVQYGAGFNG